MRQGRPRKGAEHPRAPREALASAWRAPRALLLLLLRAHLVELLEPGGFLDEPRQIRVRRGAAQPVVRAPVLREVVRAHAAVAAEEEVPSRLLVVRVEARRALLAPPPIGQAGAQHAHGLVAVAVLRALVLDGHADACGRVRHAHGRIGRVDVLPARAGAALGLHAEVCMARSGMGRASAGWL